MVVLLPKLNYLTSQSFDFERTLWMIFQKRVVRTKFDIYVFIEKEGCDRKDREISFKWTTNS